MYQYVLSFQGNLTELLSEVIHLLQHKGFCAPSKRRVTEPDSLVTLIPERWTHVLRDALHGVVYMQEK